MPRLHLALFCCPLVSATAAAQNQDDLRPAIDAYFDTWFTSPADRRAASRALAKRLQEAKLDVTAAERLLRAGRAALQPIPAKEQVPAGKLIPKLLPLRCDHVDYATGYLLFVPKSYDPTKPAPLAIIAHGGNSAMLQRRALGAAWGGTRVWTREAERLGMILAAPITERGWLRIGNSIVFSLLRKLQRRFRIDPNRIYVTGHSMGGHMTWRSALAFADRFAAFAPMSGGYNFVARKQIQRLLNTAAFATYCKREPYGIDRDNATNAAWLRQHGYAWRFVQAPGSHTIPTVELPKIADFFTAHPRNPYPERVYAQKAGRLRIDAAPDVAGQKRLRWARTASWKGPHTWNKNRPIDVSPAFWLRFVPRDPLQHEVEDADGKKVRRNILQTASARRAGNDIELTTENVRKLVVYLHPKMVDFAKPVRIRANGKVCFEGQVRPSLATMLEFAHEFDDRGRLFHAAVPVSITTDRTVPIPKGKR